MVMKIVLPLLLLFASKYDDYLFQYHGSQQHNSSLFVRYHISSTMVTCIALPIA